MSNKNETAYQLAAEQGDAYAQIYLGFMYANGRGVPQDYKAAVKWYRLAAEQGNAEAQFYLGLMYQDGKEQGDAFAQYNLEASLC